MKFDFKPAVIILVFFLVSLNIYMFAKTVVIGDEILRIEKNIKKVKIENSDLEKKLYSLSSIRNLEKTAVILGFTEKSEPFFLKNLNYAFAR